MNIHNICEVQPEKTYEFRSGDDYFQVMFGILPDGNFLLSPHIIAINDLQKKGAKPLLSLLPLSVSLDYSAYTLATGIEVAELRGWTISTIS